MTTFIRPAFTPWHIPPLFIATTFTFGGLLPFRNPVRAMQEFGLPPRVAASKEAHSAFAAYGSRTVMLGILLYTAYFRSDTAMLDTIMQLMVVAGAADWWICWKEGVARQGAFRFASGLVLGAYGYFGLTWRGN